MGKKKLAILLSRFPYPLDKGDKLRAYHQLVYLSSRFDIYLYCLADEEINENDRAIIQQLCAEIHVYCIPNYKRITQGIVSVLKNEPFQVGYFYSANVKKEIEILIIKLNPDIIYCQLSRMAKYAVGFTNKKAVDYQDAFSKNYVRIASQSNGIKKWFYQYESNAMQNFETKIASWFDATAIISTFDKNALVLENNKTHVIGNGVDFDYFTPQQTEKKYDVVFCGNINYLPNELAVKFIIEKIAPLLIKKIPTIQIAIAGKYDGSYFKTFATNNIHILGWQQDMRKAYAASKLFVAPLFTGAGIQNKLLEAMSMQIPCITTSVANASLQANIEEIEIANTDTEFANAIIKLLAIETLRNTMAIKARQFIEKNYNWNIENEKLFQLLNNL
jgi:sugar transferase (PEP-CTERM/EpsH1 system associated)